ncbi:amidase [Sutcliffiella cohnii]|uniref:amidase n=1 Tax=Sutcliffiella cohnii TaxID=33932 RepID=UPI002E1E99DE|nr:amidase [Sutcliffiella cohnii]
MTEIYKLTATELAPLIETRKVSPVDVTTSIMERIERLDSAVNAYITTLPELAIQQAKNAEAEIMNGRYKGPLHGIPVGIKDNKYTKGIRTTGGSALLKQFVPDYDATVVKKLLCAGSIMTGKLNMHEFGGGLTNTNPAYGNTRNPWNLEHSPGGSSGGSGAALAAGLATLTTGTDTFGSIRVPAAMCGIYGLKPTYGLVSSYGVAPLAWSLDHIGPMARSVSDLAIVLNEMVGYDPNDPGSIKAPKPDYKEKLVKDMKGLKIGVPSLFLQGLEPDVEMKFKEALSYLNSLGVHIIELEIPELELATFANYVITTGEASSYHYERLQQNNEGFADDVRIFFQTGIVTDTPQYVRAQQARRVVANAVKEAFEQVDILAGPTIPITAPKFQEDIVPFNIEITKKCMPFTAPANVTGNPALSIPIGLSTKGLPIGMQIIGKHLDEKLLLQVGALWDN